MFKKRIGPDPHAKGPTEATKGCPDVWELDDGSFAVIGFRAPELASLLPEGASCGPDEQIIILPRRVLVDAKNDIPNA